MGGANAFVDVESVRFGADDDDVGAGVLEDLRGTAAGCAVGAVQDNLQAVQAVRKRAEQVHDVAVLGVGEALDAAHFAADGPEGLLAQLLLDGVLDVVGQLLAAAGEELDPVVRRGVVGGGDHHAEVGVEVGHQVGGRRGGEHAGVVDVDAGAGEPGLHGGGEELATGAGVPWPPRRAAACRSVLRSWPSTTAAAWASCIASSAVSRPFARPRTPSVPNNLDIGSSLDDGRAQPLRQRVGAVSASGNRLVASVQKRLNGKRFERRKPAPPSGGTGFRQAQLLALGVLLSLTGLLETGLLTLDDAGVTAQVTGLLQGGAVVLDVDLVQ